MTDSTSGRQPDNILFVSHKEKHCGVHDFGISIAEALKKSEKYSFVYAECSSPQEFWQLAEAVTPAAIIYNYYPSTLPWLNREVIRKFNVPHLGIMHEVSREAADSADNHLFDFHIAPDPTLVTNNPIVFKTGRLIPTYTNSFPVPTITTIGSFGFATAGKGFERLMIAVQEEFDEAIIRLHIPFGDFADSNAENMVKLCRKLLVKRGIRLITNHEFLSKTQLLDFLAQNTLNAFFYEHGNGRGISSVVENALAVRRPMAITRSNMFRHVLSDNPFTATTSICIEPATEPELSRSQEILLKLKRRWYMSKSHDGFPLKWLLRSQPTLRQIIENGTKPLSQFYSEWSEPNLIMDYERILNRVLGRLRVQDPVYVTEPVERNFKTGVPAATSFNRILDNSARVQYEDAIGRLFSLAPDLMPRKIPEANIQQAFVLDTVEKFAARFESPKMLCIGSFEDTAAASLRKLGYRFDEVDPVVNYDLATFFHNPATLKGSYDIIFSTSVLEHVQNDELFMTQIAELLSPGGTAILTCDFNDQYEPGHPIPREDFRLYTKKDLLERILPLLQDCLLVDEPQWDCPDPDFTYANCRYTFATLVFQKKPTNTLSEIFLRSPQ